MQQGLGKSRKTAPCPQIPGSLPIPGKKLIFPPLPPLSPFSEMGEDQKIPQSHLLNFLLEKPSPPPPAIPPPKNSFQKSLGMTLNCFLLPKKARALLGYFQSNSWGFVGSDFQGYFHAQLASIQGEFPDPTEIPGAFKILSSLISWSQIQYLEGFGNFGIFSCCENLKFFCCCLGFCCCCCLFCSRLGQSF